MKVVPISISDANKIVASEHRHNKPVRVSKFAIAAEHDGRLVGVAIVGQPCARALTDGKTVEVRRLVSYANSPKGTCSFLYGACRRAASALGYSRVLTYTLESESGASLRGAGWTPEKASRPHQWVRPDAAREEQQVCSEQKIRWSTRCGVEVSE